MNLTQSPYPFLSIIIVNFKSASLIEACISSLQQHGTGRYEIIIVDNSQDASGKQMVERRFPFVKWIDMGYNAGFARANNAGMQMAQGNAFLLLNPDTLALDNSIDQCFDQLMDSSYVAAGVQLYDEQQRPQISGNYFMKGGLNHLLPIPYWGTFLRWLGYQLNSKIPNVQEAKAIEEVDWISGAFLMVKRQVVEQAGMLDEDFFLYAEEIEWCSRLRKVGSLCIFGQLRFVHLEGATINKSQNLQEKGYYNLYDKKGLQLMVSNHLRVRKQFGVGWFLFLLLNYTWGVLVFFVCGLLHSLFKLQSPFSLLQRVLAFGKNVVKLWLLTPKIIANKPHFYKMF